MRIAIDVRGLGSPKQSGVGEYTLEILRALFEIGSEHDFVLFSSGTETVRRHVLDNLNLIDIDRYRSHVRHEHLPTPNKILNLGIVAQTSPKLDDLVDCDIFFFPNLNYIATGRTPSVVTLHDLSWKIFPHFFKARGQVWHRTVRPERTLSTAQAIITPSTSTKQDAIDQFGIDPEKMSVIPHGINHKLFQPKMLPQDHGIRSQYRLPEKYILFMGTIEPRKNLHALLDALDNQTTRQPDNLVIAGGPGWRSDDILDRFKQMTNVHYLGYVPHEHRPALYRAARAFVFPSIYEGFGLPVLEAMACGTPVITSHTSSLPETVGNAALLINPYNSNDIATALNELSRSDNLRADLVKAGLEQAQKFNWQKAAQKTLEVLCTVDNPAKKT